MGRNVSPQPAGVRMWVGATNVSLQKRGCGCVVYVTMKYSLQWLCATLKYQHIHIDTIMPMFDVPDVLITKLHILDVVA